MIILDKKSPFCVGTALLYAVGWSFVLILLVENMTRWSGWKIDLVDSWLKGLVERVWLSHYCWFMLALLTVFVCYGLLQLIGIKIDRSLWSNKSFSLITKLLAPMTGRCLAKIDLATLNQQRELSYHILTAPLAFGTWVMPLLGFIGTIVGISSAIAELPQLQAQNGDMETVLSNLHVAFDTTFIGLISAILLSIISFVIQIQWYSIDHTLGIQRNHESTLRS